MGWERINWRVLSRRHVSCFVCFLQIFFFGNLLGMYELLIILDCRHMHYFIKFFLSRYEHLLPMYELLFALLMYFVDRPAKNVRILLTELSVSTAGVLCKFCGTTFVRRACIVNLEEHSRMQNFLIGSTVQTQIVSKISSL